MSDVKHKMKRKSSLPKYAMLAYYFIKSTGLAPFTVKNNRFYPPTLLGKLYPVFVATSYILFVSRTFIREAEALYAANYSQFVKVWGTIQFLMNIPCTSGTIIIFLSMHKKIVYLMNKLCTINSKFKSLGIEEDHGNYFKNLFLASATAHAVIFVTWIMLFCMESEWDIFAGIKHYTESCFATNMILIFAHIMIYIEKCFTLVNEGLNDLVTPAAYRRCPYRARIFVVSLNNRREEDQPESEGPSTHFQRIRIIGTLHMELSDLLHLTTHLFTGPIVLHSLRYFADGMLFSYWLCLELRNSGETKIVLVCCYVLKIVLISVQLFIIAHASQRFCEQGNATKAVLFKVWTKLTTGALTDESVDRTFLKFSNQLLHTRVAVSAYGFLGLGYPFIIKIFGMAITYLIVAIQFETSGTSP